MSGRGRWPGGSRTAIALGLVAGLAAGCAITGDEAAESDRADANAEDSPSPAALIREADALDEAPAMPQADADARLAEALGAIYVDQPAESDLRYVRRFVDLNDDDNPEAVAFVYDTSRCEDGCDLFILRPAEQRYEVINRVPTARPPLRVANERHDGWQDLTYASVDAAGANDARQTLLFIRRAYQPAETRETSDSQGRVVIPSIPAAEARSLP